jgi:glycosyltransferase involved in cell wall biosynthesis
MRVWLRIRGDIETYPGGDAAQYRETRRALEDLGVTCLFDSDVSPGLGTKVDLVHLFNTTRITETHEQFLEAQSAGLPVVVSTIWHSMKEIGRFLEFRFRIPQPAVWPYSALREAYYCLRSKRQINWSAVFRYRGLQQAVVEAADAVLPNSFAELSTLERELGVKPRAAYVIPNGVRSFQKECKLLGSRRDILCVGRIEPRKNQLKVIEAFLKLGLADQRLLLIGAVNPSHKSYSEKVFSFLRPGLVEYVGLLQPEELSNYYQRAKVTVLASFFETTGLVVLEGLASGANAVVLDSPTTREYFGGYASFCDPYQVDSIAAAIKQAFAAPPKDVSSLVDRFSWAEAGRLTHDAYQAVLKRRTALSNGLSNCCLG